MRISWLKTMATKISPKAQGYRTHPPPPPKVIPNDSILLINFSSPRLQDLQRIGMGEPSEFVEQLYYRMIISTMGRQEIRVMSTRQGDEVPFLPSSVVEKSWLPLFECLSIDALQIKNKILSRRVFQGRRSTILRSNEESKKETKKRKY